MDEDLQRRVREAQVVGNVETHRQLTLLLTVLRFAGNSYEAVCFLVSDTDNNNNSRRVPRYVLILPAVNRQIMDLWFTLVYMMDDFGVRALAYELCAYRQLREQIDETRSRYGNDPDWLGWFKDTEDLTRMMERELDLTPDQKANPKSINSWPHPHALTEKQTNSQHFLKCLHDLLYAETSIEAHLKPSGLMRSAGILLSDIAPEHIGKLIEERTIHQYRFMHIFRTVITLLAIASEIDCHCKLQNRVQIIEIWEKISKTNADAKDIYDARYKSLLAKSILLNNKP